MFYNTTNSPDSQALPDLKQSKTQLSSFWANGLLPDQLISFTTMVCQNEMAIVISSLIAAVSTNNQQFDPWNFSSNDATKLLGYTRKTTDKYISILADINLLIEQGSVIKKRGRPVKMWSINFDFSRATLIDYLCEKYRYDETDKLYDKHMPATPSIYEDMSNVDSNFLDDVREVDHEALRDVRENEIEKLVEKLKVTREYLLNSDRDTFSFTPETLPKTSKIWRQEFALIKIAEDNNRLMREWTELLGTQHRNTVSNTLKAINHKRVPQIEEVDLLEINQEVDLDSSLKLAEKALKIEASDIGMPRRGGYRIPGNDQIRWLNPETDDIKKTLQHHLDVHGLITLCGAIQKPSLYVPNTDNNVEQQQAVDQFPLEQPETVNQTSTYQQQQEKVREHFLTKYKLYFDKQGDHLTNEEIVLEIIAFWYDSTPAEKADVRARVKAFVDATRSKKIRLFF